VVSFRKILPNQFATRNELQILVGWQKEVPREGRYQLFQFKGKGSSRGNSREIEVVLCCNCSKKGGRMLGEVNVGAARKEREGQPRGKSEGEIEVLTHRCARKARKETESASRP